MNSKITDMGQGMPVGCGERLRAAREAAGLSVDDVASRLHMPARVVRSLEVEDWSRLGAPVFVRGQVRSYSRLLGLMTAPMMDAIDVGPVEPSQLVSRTHTPKAQWWAEQVGRRLIYIVLTLSLALPAWIATRQHLSGGAGVAAPLDMPVSDRAMRVSGQKVQRTMVASMTPVSSAPSIQQASDVIVRTRAESWFEVISPDGSVLEKGLLPAGSERRYAGTQVARVTIGNASAVAVQHLGRDVDLKPLTRANVARFTVSSEGALVASD